MITVNPNVYPKGGFVFKEPATGGLITGTTWPGVIGRLVSYRKRHNIPLGDPTKDVMAYACSQNAGICTDTDSPPEKARARQLTVTNLKGRLLTWFGKIKKPFGAYVSEGEAQRRSDICAVCPLKTSLPEGCASCRAAAEELRKRTIEGRRPDGRLVDHGCLVLGTDLATQAWLDLHAEDQAELPAHCWRKRTV